jgi:hypothetical protein
VKTLSDRPRLLPLRSTSLGHLTHLRRPASIRVKRLPLERHVYRLVVAVTSVERATSGELRLALADGAARMTAAAPSSPCARHAKVDRRRQMASARGALRTCARARVVGVAFWGRRGPANGSAPSGIELHPILAFKCLASGSPPPPSPPPPPAPPPPPPPPTEPPPIAGQSYHEVFRDDFQTLNRSIWDDHIWYDTPPKPSWTGFQTAQDGILHLRTSKNFYWGSGASDNWPINTITTLSSGRTFTLGYFEARMKWTAARGAWPGFWLLSYRHATNPAWPNLNPYCAAHGLLAALCWSAELDVFEGQGTEPQVFYGTSHRNSSEDYGVGDSQNGNNYTPVEPDLSAAFHTYGMLWTSSQISWYLDGHLLMSAPVYDSTSQPMFLLLQMWVGGWTAEPNSSTPDLETQVDYVSAWQK